VVASICIVAESLAYCDVRKYKEREKDETKEKVNRETQSAQRFAENEKNGEQAESYGVWFQPERSAHRGKKAREIPSDKVGTFGRFARNDGHLKMKLESVRT